MIKQATQAERKQSNRKATKAIRKQSNQSKSNQSNRKITKANQTTTKAIKQ